MKNRLSSETLQEMRGRFQSTNNPTVMTLLDHIDSLQEELDEYQKPMEFTGCDHCDKYKSDEHVAIRCVPCLKAKRKE